MTAFTIPMIVFFTFLIGYQAGNNAGYKLGACKDAPSIAFQECLRSIK